MSYQEEKEVALQAVMKASVLCKKVQFDLLAGDSITKKDRSPVTIADFGAQAVIISEILKYFPNDPIVGEEDSAMLRQNDNIDLKNKLAAFVRQIKPEMSETDILETIDKGGFPGKASGRQWTLDPIDGTKGFLRGDQYAIALALIEDGEVVLGVLGCPNLPQNLREIDPEPGQFYCAVRGGGAYVKNSLSGEFNKIHVDDISQASEAVFCESVESGHTSHSHSALIARKLGVQKPPVRIDSQCKYAVVSRGDASIYLRLPTRPGYEEKIWDHAAGLIMIEEAGGKVTDIYGKDLDFSLGRTLRENKGVIVTNGGIHEEVLLAVKDVLEL